MLRLSLLAIIIIFGVVLWIVPWGESIAVGTHELSTLPCEPTVPIRFAGSGVTEEDAFSFFNNGFIGFKVCTKQTVRFTARGSTVNEIGAHLVIHNTTTLLWEGLVVSDKEIALNVSPGWITVGFLNDEATEIEDRNLWIFGLSFED